MEMAPTRTNSAPPLLTALLAALDDIEPADLRSLLADLADALRPEPVGVAIVAAHTNEVAIRLDPPPADSRLSWPPPSESIRRLVAQNRGTTRRHANRRRRPHVKAAAKAVAMHVLVPMSIVTSALVALMAWMR